MRKFDGWQFDYKLIKSNPRKASSNMYNVMKRLQQYPETGWKQLANS